MCNTFAVFYKYFSSLNIPTSEWQSMRNFFFALSVLLVLVPSQSQATCYTVHSPQGKVIYQSSVSPIDLSQSISAGMNASFPGHSLVTSSGMTNCHEIQTNTSAQKVASASGIKGSKKSEDGTVGSTDLSNFFETKDEMYVSSNPAFVGSARAAGTDVNVRAYTRADGTQVRAHTRAASGSGRKGK
jgi:hypothetical protein